MEQKSAYQCFDEIINQVDTCIQFNPDWNNGTGYLDGAAEDKSINLLKGEMARSLTVDEVHPVLNHRRILLIGVGDGTNVVVFERHCNGADEMIVSNTPHHLAGFENRTQSHTSLNPKSLDLILAEIAKL
ncbi:MAG: hypothetical protein RR585_01920 [Coprobacillus sp.]